MGRAVIYTETGSPEVLQVVERPAPEPGPGEVAVKVTAAGLNPIDSKQLSGFMQIERPFPRGLGFDVAGTVTAIGEGAVYWDGAPIAIGDEVFGTGTDTLAQDAIASAGALAKRPENLSAEVAGGLFVAGLTGVSVITTVPVTSADTVLVGGAAGAVGMVAAQLAVAAGARVIGTASARNHEFLRSIGVAPVAYGEGLVDRVRELGEITAVFDCHGRDALDVGVALGVPVDRMVAIAAYAALDELGVLNVEREARTPENLAKLGQQIAAGDIVFPVAETFPLDRAADAFTSLDGSHPIGKIVVLPQE